MTTMSGLEVNATAVHPFFVGGRWIEVKDIKVGDVLTTYSGEVARVDSIKIEKGQFTVYNFSVEDFASYYVADPKVLVHNCPPSNPTKKYDVGPFDELKSNSAPHDGLDIHHFPQKHPAGQVIPGYDPKKGTAMAVPTKQHKQIPTQKGQYSGTARDLLAKDAKDARKVGIPNETIQKGIDEVKKAFPND